MRIASRALRLALLRVPAPTTLRVVPGRARGRTERTDGPIGGSIWMGDSPRTCGYSSGDAHFARVRYGSGEEDRGRGRAGRRRDCVDRFGTRVGDTRAHDRDV